MGKPVPLLSPLGPLEVAVYGRWFFKVGSETRPGEVEHFVDLEPELNDEGKPLKGGQPWRCSCEAHFYNTLRPCKHTRVVLSFLRPVLKYLAAFGKTPSSYQTKRYEMKPDKMFEKQSG